MSTSSSSETPIDEEFAAAAAYIASGRVNDQISDEDLLSFYAYYKQTTEGPCDKPKPAFFDLKAKAKWQAWTDLGEMSLDAAREHYIALLTKLRPTWREEVSSPQGKYRGGAGAGGGGVFSSLAHARESDDDGGNDDGNHENNDTKSIPLIVAVQSKDAEQVRQLLVHGADPEQRDTEGCTALHWCADKGFIAGIKELVQAGADVNALDVDGMTPLHYAAQAGQKGAGIALVVAGADAGIKTTDGVSVQDVAPPDWRDTVFKQLF